MGQGNIIGYEINEKTCQISFYNEEMESYNSALQNVDLGNTQTIKFVDITTNVNVSVSPITCLIECEEVEEK